jgi:hypothetical protein
MVSYQSTEHSHMLVKTGVASVAPKFVRLEGRACLHSGSC